MDIKESMIGKIDRKWGLVLAIYDLIVSLRNAIDASMVAEVVRLRILPFPSEFSRIRLQVTI
jgi:hypothetical protein